MNTYFETTWTLSIAGTWATVEMLPGSGGLSIFSTEYLTSAAVDLLAVVELDALASA